MTLQEQIETVARRASQRSYTGVTPGDVLDVCASVAWKFPIKRGVGTVVAILGEMLEQTSWRNARRWLKDLTAEGLEKHVMRGAN